MRLRHGLSGVGIVVSMLLGVGIASSAVEWQPTLDSACALAAQTNRLVLIHFWGDGCPPCARMETEVFSRPDVAGTIARNYVAVKVNKAQFPNLANQFGVNAVPTDVVVTPQGRVIGSYVGAVPPAQFIGRLEQIASVHRGPSAGMYAQQAPASATVSSYPPMPAAQGPVSAVQSPVVAAQSPVAAMQPPLPATQPPLPAAQMPPGMVQAAGTPQGYGGAGAYAAPQPSQAMMAPANTPYSTQYNPNLAPSDAYGSNPNPVPPLGYGGNPNSNLAVSPVAPSAYGVNPGAVTQPQATPGPTYPANPGMSSGAPAGSGQFGPSPASPPLAARTPAETPGWNADRTPPSQALAPGAPAQAPGVVQGNSPGGMPPLALDGFCPVRLAQEWRWVPGDPAWGAFHEGRTYLFAGPQEQQAFLSDPNRYAPVLSGRDVVSLVEQGRDLPGNRNFGARWNDRVYLFNSQENYERFRVNPTLYESSLSRDPVASVRPNYGTSMTARTPGASPYRPY